MFIIERKIALGLGLSFALWLLEMVILAVAGLPTHIWRPVSFICFASAAAFFVSGLKIIRVGERALLITLSKRNEKPESEMDEGLWWVTPIVSQLRRFNMSQRSEVLADFYVETGTNLTEHVILSGEWAISPGHLYAISHIEDLERTLKDHCRAQILGFLRFVDKREDIVEGEMLQSLGELLLKSANHRLLGNQTKLVGQSWRDLDFEIIGSRPSWGIELHTVNFTGMNASASVATASESAAVDNIRKNSAVDVGEGLVSIIKPVIEAGGHPQLAQQAAQSHMMPEAQPLETLSPPVLIQANDGSPGVSLSVETPRVSASTKQIATAEKKDDRP